jgi:hypothetical protein
VPVGADVDVSVGANEGDGVEVDNKAVALGAAWDGVALGLNTAVGVAILLHAVVRMRMKARTNLALIDFASMGWIGINDKLRIAVAYAPEVIYEEEL